MFWVRAVGHGAESDAAREGAITMRIEIRCVTPGMLTVRGYYVRRDVLRWRGGRGGTRGESMCARYKQGR